MRRATNPTNIVRAPNSIRSQEEWWLTIPRLMISIPENQKRREAGRLMVDCLCTALDASNHPG